MPERGFTLMELIVVMVLVAIVTTGAAMGLGALSGGALQSSAGMIVSASRYAYSRAVANGTTVRMVLDFEARTVQLQETTGRVVLNREDETGVGLNRKEYEDRYLADGSVEERSMKERLRNIGPVVTGQSVDVGTGGQGLFVDPFLQSLQAGLSGGDLRYRGPRFQLIDGKRGESRELSGKIAFLRVFSEHTPRPIESDHAFVYFFPGGMTQHTWIQIGDPDEGASGIRTLVIHPLTGVAAVHPEEMEPDGELHELQEGVGR